MLSKFHAALTLAFAVGLSLSLSQGALAAERLSPADAAAQVDALLAEEIDLESESEVAAATDDETFLRRVSLDLIGELPSPEQVTAFVLDPQPGKRTALVERLLADPRFGQNWSRYWRDVIMYRRSEDRALAVVGSLEAYLTEQFNRGTPWNEITKAFVTASGDVRENGATAVFVAQSGQTEDIAAEVSRIFMGVQIQCAQCHDHKTDRWKREQFHQFAAFFPRVQVKRGQGQYEVVSRGAAEPKRKKNNNKPQRGPEHYMPDLDDPSVRGTLVHPKFFVTNHAIEQGKPDLDRRTILANLLTAPSNPWFAKAYVNRIWAEMVGEGFYEPIDDMGPDRECSAPETIGFLADQFVTQRYDVKWLYRTIAATEAYQRQSRSRRNSNESPFMANCPQRLRADQLFGVLTTALEVPKQGPGRGGRYGGAQAALRTPQGQFQQAFGYDPSEPRDEVAGSIPQALFLMNSPIVNGAIESGRPGSALGKLLARTNENEDVAVELYLRCLGREPDERELATVLDHVDTTSSRGDGFEDVLWVLVNSTEFLHRK